MLGAADRPVASATVVWPAAAGSPLAGLSPTWQRALFLPLIILAWLAVLIVVGWAAGHLTRTIVLVVLAAIIAFALTPVATFFTRWVSRPLAIGLAYLLGVGLILGVGAFIVATAATQVAGLVADAPTYAQQAQTLEPRAEAILGPFGISPGAVADLQQQFIGQVQAVGTTVASEALGWLATLFGTVVDLVLVLILSIYLAANGHSMANWLRNEAPDHQQHRATLLLVVVNRVVGGYVRGTLILATLIGALVGVGMAVLGVPYAVLLGVLAFFMEFIPVLGVFISGVAAVGIAGLHFQEPIRPLLVLAYFVVVHIIEGDVVGPRILGKAVGIHPATGLIALVAGTELFGIWGALFAAPLAGLLQAVVTAAWVEWRGGGPREVMQAVTNAETDDAAREMGMGESEVQATADPTSSAPLGGRSVTLSIGPRGVRGAGAEVRRRCIPARCSADAPAAHSRP
jgi:predicted PurR-regulated permease PerM